MQELKTIYSKIRNFLRNIPYYNVVTLAPTFLVVILPNFLQPEWIWRLTLSVIAATGVTLFCLRVIIVPDLLMKEFRRDLTLTTRRVLHVIGIVCFSFGALIFSTHSWEYACDLIHYKELQTKRVLIQDVHRNGIGGAFGFSVEFNNQTFSTLYYFGAVEINKEYIITYSDQTKRMYEIQSIVE